MVDLRNSSTRATVIEGLQQLVEALRSRDEFARLLHDIALGDHTAIDRAERLMERRGRAADSEQLSAAIWTGAEHDAALRRLIEHQFRLQTRTFGGKEMSRVSRALRGILPESRQPRSSVLTRRGVLMLRITEPFFDIRHPPDAIEVKIALPDAQERATGVKVSLRAEVVRSRSLGDDRGRFEPVMTSRNKTLEWVDLYDWSGLIDLLTTAGAAWLQKAYKQAVEEAESESDAVQEARKRRIRRRLTTMPRRFYGRAKSGQRMSRGRLPKAARPPKRLVRPRVRATDPSSASELRRAAVHYERNKGPLKSRGKQMRRLPWYKLYQKRLRKLALSKGTRRR